MAVNFIGTALGIRAVVPEMIQRGGGSIVTVASVDQRPLPNNSYLSMRLQKALSDSLRALLQWIMRARESGPMCSVPVPCFAGLFERHMKSAKDPEKFHATRAARQPNGNSGPFRCREGRTIPSVGRIRRLERLRADR